MQSIDERQLEVAHQLDVTVKDGQTVVAGELLNHPQELHVRRLVLAFDKAEEGGERHVVFHRGVENVELCVPGEHALEGAVRVDDLRSGQPPDGHVVAKDEEVFPVVFQKMMFFGFDDFFQIIIIFFSHFALSCNVDRVSVHGVERSDLNLFSSRHWVLAGHVDRGLFVQKLVFPLLAFFEGLLLPRFVFSSRTWSTSFSFPINLNSYSMMSFVSDFFLPSKAWQCCEKMTWSTSKV